MRKLLACVFVAAAMLGASIHYALRGCVTWKSIVGTNVAADALSNLASPGVVGGALIVVAIGGEFVSEGATLIEIADFICRHGRLRKAIVSTRPACCSYCATGARMSNDIWVTPITNC